MSSYEVGERCGTDNCDSNRWRANNDNTESCENGHTRPRYSAGDDELEDYHLLGDTTRRKRDKVEKVSRVPAGREQKTVLLLCHQWIIRKQIWWLIHEKNFPPEYEELIRALWEQRLNALADKFDDEAITNFAAEDSDIEENDDIQMTLIKMDAIPTIAETLALCYLGIYIMRLPVFPGDILRWVEGKELLYLAATSALPADMTTRLNVTSTAFLLDKRMLTAQRLAMKTGGLFMAYQRHLKLELPALNLPLCLYRCVQDLALPLEIYPSVKRLAAMIDESFEFPTQAGMRWLSKKPESQLAALVIVAVKLLYPFDSDVRHPSSAAEPAVAVMNWDAWVESKEQRDAALAEHEIMTYEQAQKTTERDISLMSDTKIDEYMDWFAETWAKTGEQAVAASKDEFAAEMLALFPIDRAPVEQPRKDLDDINNAKLLHLHEVQNKLIIQSIKPTRENDERSSRYDRPGTQYTRYRNIREVEGSARKFYETVADYVGLPLHHLTKTVFSTERRLEAWMREQRRAEMPTDE